jgi:acyl carrier protein
MTVVDDNSGGAAATDLQQSVRALISENSGIEVTDAISNTDDLFEAGLQSLDCVRILIAIEDDFEIELPNDIIERKLFSTVENLSAAISEAKA